VVEQISIPEGLNWSCSARQQIIRIRADDDLRVDLPDRLDSFLKPGQMKGRTELVLEFSAPSMLEGFRKIRWRRPKVRVLVSDDQLGEIHRCRAQFNAVCPTLVLDQSKSSLPRSIQFLASLNLPIEVNASVFMDQNEKSLLDLAERLLFSPFVKTPVQPFFGLLQSVMAAGTSVPITLWNTCKEDVGQNYFITKDGKITLSKRWADENRFFGDISNTIDEIRSSNFFRELNSIKKVGSTISSECLDCCAFKFCSGYLRALNSTHDCTPFMSLYEFMRSHVPSLKESFATLPKQKKRDVFQAIEKPIQRPPNQYSARRPQVDRPTSAVVFVSNKCTNNCIFCAPADKRKLGHVVSDEKIMDFILRCASEGIKTLLFSGAGEPTLNPNLPEYVTAAKSSGIKRTIITSNGTELSENLLTRLKITGNDAFVFSLHGIGDIHDSTVQHAGSYANVINSISLARKMEMRVGLNTCLVKANLDQIAEILDLGKKYCTLEHTLSFPEWSGNALKKVHLLPSYKEACQALAKLDWGSYPLVAVDNFPRCMIPSGARCVRQSPVIQYQDLSLRIKISTALNFGNNVFPECCTATNCKWMTKCVGVDEEYLHRVGVSEFTDRCGAQNLPVGKRSTALPTHGPSMNDTQSENPLNRD
jgi:radical SAM protein with 4Fe4S-binding SPASM domain